MTNDEMIKAIKEANALGEPVYVHLPPRVRRVRDRELWTVVRIEATGNPFLPARAMLREQGTVHSRLWPHEMLPEQLREAGENAADRVAYRRDFARGITRGNGLRGRML